MALTSILVLAFPVWGTVLLLLAGEVLQRIQDWQKRYKPVYSDYERTKADLDALLKRAEETVRRWEV